MRKMARFMAGGFRALNNRLDGLEDRFEGLQLSLRMHSSRPNVGLERLLAWLNAIFTDEDWEKARNSRTLGTCRWILERATFRDWATSVTATNAMRILWIHGPPGFGKTVLSASIVEHLQNENPAQVAHFFCVSDHEAKRQPLAIIRSWVAQMVRQNGEALEAAEEAYHGKEGRPATTYDVWQLFAKICQRIPNCFFVVDGFDECIKTDKNMHFTSSNDVVSFLQGLVGISRETPSHILLVSREDADVRVPKIGRVILNRLL
jgi:Cdc6-like AAA superfamily ATPase